MGKTLAVKLAKKTSNIGGGQILEFLPVISDKYVELCQIAPVRSDGVLGETSLYFEIFEKGFFQKRAATPKYVPARRKISRLPGWSTRAYLFSYPMETAKC